VFGTGLEWGTAYLGPDGLLPGSARSFIPVPRPGPEPPKAPTLTLVSEPAARLEPDADLTLDAEPEPVAAAVTGMSLGTWRQPTVTPAPQPAGPPVASPVPGPPRQWGGSRTAYPGYVEPGMPTDVKIVVGAAILTAIVAAILVGVLVSSALIAAIVAGVCLLAITGFLWMTRL
jgi:hypothetical protein